MYILKCLEISKIKNKIACIYVHICVYNNNLRLYLNIYFIIENIEQNTTNYKIYHKSISLYFYSVQINE